MSKPITWSALEREIKNFLAFKRSVGFKYETGEASLRRFQRFVEPLLRKRPQSLKTILDSYIAEHGRITSQTFSRDFSRVLALCLYRRREHSRSYVPARPEFPRRKEFLPYLLTDREVKLTLTAARRYSGVNPSCSGETAYLLVLICYCTGLRIGEAIRLQLEDVDLSACTFHVRDSKRKTRDVPFGRDLGRRLRKYLRIRASWTHSTRTETSLLLDLRGCPLGYARAWVLLTLLWRELGLKPPRGRGGPRPTDLRHSFARGRLEAWDRKGKDVNALLPWLSAYLGHVDLLGTEIYLHSTPELLRRASRRFEQRFRQAGAS